MVATSQPRSQLHSLRRPRRHALTPSDYRAKKAAIEMAYAAAQKWATRPSYQRNADTRRHFQLPQTEPEILKIWQAIESFEGQPFERRALQERIPGGLNDPAYNYQLAGRLWALVRAGWLRRISRRQGRGRAIVYQQTPGKSHLEQVRRQYKGDCARLERLWRESPFYGLNRSDLKRLDDVDRQVLQRRLDGKSLSEIAHEDGCSHEWIRQVQNRALKRLEELGRR